MTKNRIKEAFIVVIMACMSVISTQALATSFVACAPRDSQCIESAASFQRTSAAASNKRLVAIIHALKSQESIRGQSILEQEQYSWQRNTNKKCESGNLDGNANSSLSKSNCLKFEQDNRSIELDKKLAALLQKKGKSYWDEGVPIHLSDTFLDIDYGSGTYNTETARFDLLKSADTSFQLTFSTPGANGHQCSGEANLRKQNGILVFNQSIAQQEQQAEGDSKDQCYLKVEVFPFHVSIEGNYACKELFSCGERAGVAGNFFR